MDATQPAKPAQVYRYTNIEFNSLPGWARDVILAQETSKTELLRALKDMVSCHLTPAADQLLGARLAERAIAKAEGRT